MVVAVDSPESPDDDDGVPLAPPSAFGIPAHPLGCGVLGGVVFALLVAPVVLATVAPDPCTDFVADCPWPPEGTGLGLALTAWAAAAFGLATAWLVGRRLALWREGRSVRPALWASFVALFALGWGPGSVLLSLLLAAIGVGR